MAFSTPAELHALRQQFEAANDVQTPRAAVAIASTFGLSNACASQANQDDSENDVRLFGIALHSTSIKESGSFDRLGPAGCDRESALGSEPLTIPSADWRRTASEQVRAAAQYAAEEVVQPASANRAPIVTSQGPEKATQQHAAVNVDSAVSHGVAGEATTQGPQGASRSEAGTVRETQTDHNTSTSAASGGSCPQLACKASDAAAAGSAGPGHAHNAMQAHEGGHASIHTIAETQGGSSPAKGTLAVPAEEALAADCEAVAGLPDVQATQLQDASDLSSFPETQLEPVLPSWHTCATTQITDQEGCALQNCAVTPTHSTDTQPADAPLIATENMTSTNTTEVEGALAGSTPCVQEHAASADPLIQEGLQVPDSAGFRQPGSAQRGQSPAVAGTSPPLPFDESGNVRYLSVRLAAADENPSPDRPHTANGASLPQEPEAAAQGIVVTGGERHLAGVHVPSDRTIGAFSGAGSSQRPTDPDKGPDQAVAAAASALPEQPSGSHGCGAAGSAMPQQAGGEQKHPADATGPTQATVCDSSDGEPNDAAAGDGPRSQQPPAATVGLRGCQSASCGTVPETHTGDGHGRMLPSQQTVRHPRRRSNAQPAQTSNGEAAAPRKPADARMPAAPPASPGPGPVRRATPSASRGSAQLAAAMARVVSTPPSTPPKTPGKGRSSDKTRPAAHRAPAPAGQAAAAAAQANSSADRIARKRKAQQQQSARIQRAAPAVPMPAEPPRRGSVARSTPPRRAEQPSAVASPHVSPLLELDAGLRDMRPQVTPVKRARFCGSAATATPPQRTPSPSPQPRTPRERSRTPMKADLSHCTLQPTSAGTPARRSDRSMPEAHRRASPRPSVQHADPQPAAAKQQAASLAQHVAENSAGLQGVQRTGKPANRRPASTSPVKSQSTHTPTPGGELRSRDGLQQEKKQCNRPEPSAAAAAVMTESQLSLQNWIDEGPVARPAHRGVNRPEPPRFSDRPSGRAAAGTRANTPLVASPDLSEVVMCSTPDRRLLGPESEETEINQMRSHNKAAQVLDSQTAELFERQPDAGVPPQAGAQDAGKGKAALGKDHRCTAGKQQQPSPGKRPQGAPGTDSTAKAKADASNAQARRPGRREAGAGVPAPALGMGTAIPCVFVSSQQGSRSCVRQEEEGAAAAQRADVRNTHTAQGTPRRAQAKSTAQKSAAHGNASGGKQANQRATRAVSAPKTDTDSGAEAAGSGASDAPDGTVHRRQSAPVGGHWQLRRSRLAGTSSGAPVGCSTKKQPTPAGTPGRRPGTPGCELSPGGGVRRSARIAAHNIAPAADGDKAFNAIGALSQALSFSFPDTPVTPVKASAEVSRHAPQGQAGTNGRQADTKVGRRVSARPSPQPSPKRACLRSPASRDICHKRMHTPPRARSHDENQDARRTHGQTPRKPGQCHEATITREASARPLQPANKVRATATPMKQTTAGQAMLPAEAKSPQADGFEMPCKSHDLQTAETGTQTDANHGHGTSAPIETDADDLSWGTEGGCCSAWKRSYRDFMSRRCGRVSVGDVICAESADVGKIFIQVDHLWSNQCTKEDCMAGTRLYPILHTPFSVFVPGGVDKQRVLAFGDDRLTLPRSCFRYPKRVVYVGTGDKCVSETEAKQLLNDDPDCLLCHFRLEANGGMFPL